MASEPAQFVYKGVLRGHRGWVTSIATPPAGTGDFIVSASRDRTLIKWDVSPTAQTSTEAGRPVKALVGHSDFVQDVQISSTGAYALSGSWDRSLSLWDLASGQRRAVFRGHSDDVTSVAFSPDNRQIVSGSRDRTIRIWNTLGHCKFVFKAEEQSHSDSVSCIRFSPSEGDPILVTGGWDSKVKIWNVKVGLVETLTAPGSVNAVCVSPDGSLAATGGRGGVAVLWDLNAFSELYQVSESTATINSLVFSPNRYWLTAATAENVRVYDLEKKNSVAELTNPTADSKAECLSLAWDATGNVLYTGYTDGTIHVWQVQSTAQGPPA